MLRRTRQKRFCSDDSGCVQCSRHIIIEEHRIDQVKAAGDHQAERIATVGFHCRSHRSRNAARGSAPELRAAPSPPVAASARCRSAAVSKHSNSLQTYFGTMSVMFCCGIGRDRGGVFLTTAIMSVAIMTTTLANTPARARAPVNRKNLLPHLRQRTGRRKNAAANVSPNP